VNVEQVGAEADLLAEMQHVEVGHHAVEIDVGADEEVNVRGLWNGPFQVELLHVGFLHLPETLQHLLTNGFALLERDLHTNIFLVFLLPLRSFQALKKKHAIHRLPAQIFAIHLKSFVYDLWQVLDTSCLGCLLHQLLHFFVCQQFLDD
jgi:hypothetical protein